MQSLLPRAIEDPVKDEPVPRTSDVSVFVDSLLRKGLPVKKASAVVIGDVTDSAAYVTPDKTGVYSEFHVTIREVLKGDTSFALSPGTVIVATRQGGAVRFPSGHIRKYIYEGWGFPKNSRYVFFLWRDPNVTDVPDYGISTAYEITAGRINALDDGPQFDAYEGANATAFLARIKEAIEELRQKGDSQ